MAFCAVSYPGTCVLEERCILRKGQACQTPNAVDGPKEAQDGAPRVVEVILPDIENLQAI